MARIREWYKQDGYPVLIVDAHEGHGRYHNHRRQYLKIFEGRDQQETGSDQSNKNKGPVGAPILLDCRQTICLKLGDEGDRHFTCVAATQKGFCFAGNDGRMMFYERTDDKREPYIEVKSLSLGEEHHISGINLVSSETTVAAMTYAGRLLSVPTEMNIRPQSSEEDGDDEEKLVGSDVTDFSYGGNHTGAIKAAGIALERSIVATATWRTAFASGIMRPECEVVPNLDRRARLFGSPSQWLVSNSVV